LISNHKSSHCKTILSELHLTIKVSASKDFGTNRKPTLPFIPEPTTLVKKEDLAQVDLLSDPADANSMKVKFAFKILKGGNGEVARGVIPANGSSTWNEPLQDSTATMDNCVTKCSNSLLVDLL